MSEQREVEQPNAAPIALAEALLKDPEETKRLRAERKAKLARILDRGQVGENLKVELPPHLHGEWIPNTKEEIHRMEALGWWVDTEHAAKRPLHQDRKIQHGQGDGTSVVGDTIFMCCSKEDKEILDEIRHEEFLRINGNPNKADSKQKEEREFEALNRGIGMPTIDESKHRVARKEHLEAALKRTAAESSPKPTITPGTIIK